MSEVDFRINSSSVLAEFALAIRATDHHVTFHSKLSQADISRPTNSFANIFAFEFCT
jgi:hypothetical protein